MHTTSQLPVRVCVLALVALCLLARDLGLDVVLGAFAAGMVVGLATRGGAEHPPVLEHKLEAIGFGVLVPVFFIATGISFDLDALATPSTLVQVPLFLAALLVVRGLPALLYRDVLGRRDRLALALCASTSLPLVVAISAIAVADGRMATGTAAALVAAGMLSVLLFPIAAVAVRGATSSGAARRTRVRSRG
jgi:Kef-type K+ transport system membrane component KefB